MKCILSKEEFVKCIKDVKFVIDYEDGLNDHFKKYKVDGYIYPPNCIETVGDLLYKIFGEADKDEWISYFMWELDFGKKYKDGIILDSEGKNIRLDTAEKLYDFLCEISCE